MSKALLDYYVKHAISTARNLSIEVRTHNKAPINPKNGGHFQMLPVYETETYSLLKKTQEICGTTVTCVNTPPEFVDAYWKRFEIDGQPSSELTVTDQNYCRTRYFVCKELMHHYLQDTDSATTSNTALRTLIVNLVKGSSGMMENASSIVDNAAYYGALEYLLPNDTMPLAQKLFSDFSEKEGADKAYAIIAYKLRIPLSLVEYRFANDAEFNF